jgi:DNA-binding NarL/FixJ family response regulator
MRALLADDHALVRAGIRALVERIPHVEVIGEAADGLETLRIISEQHPDLVLLDLGMPKMGGFEVLDRTTKEFPETRVIVLTVHETGEYAIRAMRAGASGYLPKSAVSTELQEAIDAVSRGERYVSPEISQRTLLEFSSNDSYAPNQSLNKLTPRQREILTFIANGHSTKGIARALQISVKTVESHRAQLMERLDIHDVAGLVRYAIKVGLTKVD